MDLQKIKKLYHLSKNGRTSIIRNSSRMALEMYIANNDTEFKPSIDIPLIDDLIVYKQSRMALKENGHFAFRNYLNVVKKLERFPDDIPVSNERFIELAELALSDYIKIIF